MDIGKIAGEAMIDIVKNDGLQNQATGIMGMLFPYAGIKKKAVDIYINEISKSNLSPEMKTLCILSTRKVIKQLKNKERIAEIALANVDKDNELLDKQVIDEDWFGRFMDSASYVSVEQLQLIWGKILANEITRPGSTPPNMIRVLSEITTPLAIAFRKICSFQVIYIPLLDTGEPKVDMANKQIYVPYRGNEECLREMGVSFETINELETLGVLRFEAISGYVQKGIEHNKVLAYIDDQLIMISDHAKNELPIGNIILTTAGEALQRIIEPEEINGCFKMITQNMKENGVRMSTEHNYSAKVEGNTIEILRNEK